MMKEQHYDWLVLQPKPLRRHWWQFWRKDLHDSGYRYIGLVGVRHEGKKEIRDQLGQWHDHVLLHGPVNIDVTVSGEIRLCPWGDSHKKWVTDGPAGMHTSSAMVYVDDFKRAGRFVVEVNQIHFKVCAEVEAEWAARNG